MRRFGDATLENLEFMDSAGVGAADAAERAGFASAEALEKWLDRHDQYALWRRLKSRDPAGWHSNEKRAKRRRREQQMADNGGEAADPTAETLGALITRAQSSTRAATRRRADRISVLLDEVRTALEDEERVAAEQEQARKEVEQLERKLKAARARMRGTSPAGRPSGPAAAEVRAWARRQGVACPSKGRIPREVREAYERGTDQDAAAAS